MALGPGTPDVRVVIAGESRPLTEALAKAQQTIARTRGQMLGELNQIQRGFTASMTAAERQTLTAGPLTITLQTPDPSRHRLELRLDGEIVGRFDFRRANGGDPAAPATTDTWHFDKSRRREIGRRLIAIAKCKGLWGGG